MAGACFDVSTPSGRVTGSAIGGENLPTHGGGERHEGDAKGVKKKHEAEVEPGSSVGVGGLAPQDDAAGGLRALVRRRERERERDSEKKEKKKRRRKEEEKKRALVVVVVERE